VIVALRLRDAEGRLISDNTYVQANDDAGYQKLNSLKPQKLKLRATAATAGDERVITVQIANNGKEAALGTKLTLVDHMGVRILPALYSDNYLTVLPGEPRVVEIRYPAKLGIRATVKVRGWNVQETSVRVSGGGDAAYLPYQYPQPWQQPVTTPAPTVRSATVTVPKR
jgi:hypothetical protein